MERVGWDVIPIRKDGEGSQEEQGAGSPEVSRSLESEWSSPRVVGGGCTLDPGTFQNPFCSFSERLGDCG